MHVFIYLLQLKMSACQNRTTVVTLKRLVMMLKVEHICALVTQVTLAMEPIVMVSDYMPYIS